MGPELSSRFTKSPSPVISSTSFSSSSFSLSTPQWLSVVLMAMTCIHWDGSTSSAGSTLRFYSFPLLPSSSTRERNLPREKRSPMKKKVIFSIAPPPPPLSLLVFQTLQVEVQHPDKRGVRGGIIFPSKVVTSTSPHLSPSPPPPPPLPPLPPPPPSREFPQNQTLKKKTKKQQKR